MVADEKLILTLLSNERLFLNTLRTRRTTCTLWRRPDNNPMELSSFSMRALSLSLSLVRFVSVSLARSLNEHTSVGFTCSAYAAFFRRHYFTTAVSLGGFRVVESHRNCKTRSGAAAKGHIRRILMQPPSSSCRQWGKHNSNTNRPTETWEREIGPTSSSWHSVASQPAAAVAATSSQTRYGSSRAARRDVDS